MLSLLIVGAARETVPLVIAVTMGRPSLEAGCFS